MCAASCDVDPEDPATWHVDPLRCPLPHAPSLQMFCLYGVGKPTERAYQYLNLQTEEVPPSRNSPSLCAAKLRRS